MNCNLPKPRKSMKKLINSKETPPFFMYSYHRWGDMQSEQSHGHKNKGIRCLQPGRTYRMFHNPNQPCLINGTLSTSREAYTHQRKEKNLEAHANCATRLKEVVQQMTRTTATSHGKLQRQAKQHSNDNTFRIIALVKTDREVRLPVSLSVKFPDTSSCPMS